MADALASRAAASASARANQSITDIFKNAIPLAGLFVAILFGVILYVMFSGCKRQENFEDLPGYSVCLELSTKLTTAITNIKGRVCTLDKFTNTGVATEFETVLNTQVDIPSDKGPAEIQAVYDAGKPDREAKANSQMMAKRNDTLGNSCDGTPTLECFDNMPGNLEDWLAIQKSEKENAKILKTASIILFKWVSPNVHGYGTKGGIEGFANLTALQEFMNSCPAPTQNLPAVSDDLKKQIYADLTKLTALLPPVIAELKVCEKIQQKLKEKSDRLKNGQIDDSDIAMGATNSPVAP